MPAAKKKPTAKRKSTQKRTAKKSTPKVPAKKRVVKKVTKKTAASKSEKKKVPQKTVKRKTTARKTNSSSKISGTVKLPTKTDDRMKKKAVVLHEIVNILHVPMKQVAYVGAVCFMLIGLITIASEYSPMVSKHMAQICDATGCYDTTDPTNTLADITDPDSTNSGISNTGTEPILKEPEINFFDVLPIKLVGEIKISFQVLYASSVYGELINRDTGKLVDLQIQTLSPENYQFTLREAEHEPGNYTVVIVAESKDRGLMVERVAGNFKIEEPVVYDGNSLPSTSDSVSGFVTDANIVDESLINDSTGTIDTTIPTDTADNLNLANTNQDTNPTVNEPTVTVDTDTIQEPVNKTELEVPLEVMSSRRIWDGYEIIEAVSAQEFSNIELFARSERSLQATFIGRMRKGSETEDRVFWIYNYDSNNLPNGRYELFGLSEKSGTTHTTNSIWIEVKNPINGVPSDDLSLDETFSTNLDEFTANLNREPAEAALRDFYVLEEQNAESDISDNTEPETKPTEVENQVDDLLSENEEEINDLLVRYAIAVQSNDSIMLAVLQDEINKKRDEIISDSISDEEGEIAQVNSELMTRFEDLKGRVDSFETIRKSRTQEDISIDTDRDGVSDYDENNVYGTDPESADTDRDGYTDGAEIAKNYDPTDSNPEVLVDFELPTEVVGLKRPDVLVVTNVKPILTANSAEKPKLTAAEITGVGLPSSYVTLYIFSSPVIVTVRTEEDGSFVYRFDKELEDGEHEVFVAFTDNTGDILAHSEPFQFVKRAQAFTPVDAAETGVVTEAPTVVEASTTNALRIVLGMSILVLGFILLMFGIYLRQNEPVVEDIIVEDDAQIA